MDTVLHGDSSLTARVLDARNVLEIGVTGGTLLCNIAGKDSRSRAVANAHAHAEARISQELRETIQRYKVREVQTFAFQQRLLDEASARAERAEARVIAIQAELDAVPARVQSAVLETRTRQLKEVEALSEGLAARDAELHRLAHHEDELEILRTARVRFHHA